MTTEDNANKAPEMDKPAVAPEEAKVEVKSVEVPQKEVDPKYAGKTLEEVIEMHKNAESLATKKAQELADLKRAAPEPTVDEIAKLFAPETTPEDDPRDKEIASVKAAQIASNFKVAILEARASEEMPDWKEDEIKILELAKSKPYLMYDPNWTRTIYKLVQAEKLPDKLKEAEERGKNSMVNQEIPKVTASIISEPAPSKEPTPVPVDKVAEAKELYRKGKIKLQDYVMATLTDAEKGIK